MWNVRMRASKNVRSVKSVKKQDILYRHEDVHISGAEGIFTEGEIVRVLSRYLKRAMGHSRGLPDKITFTVEKISDEPIKISPLSVKTLKCNSPEEAKILLTKRLLKLGITNAAIERAFNILYSKSTMRGAAMVKIISGLRAEPDKLRGVRASRLGIDKEFSKKLSKRLSKFGINNERVKEALILASKIAYHKNIIAEVCISDDPEYTTGYIASSLDGYLRIPNIKNFGDMSGGRVFFISEDADISGLLKYIEKTPVIIGE